MADHTEIINFDDPIRRSTRVALWGALRGCWEFTWKRYRPTRSNAANRYYHGVIVKTFREYLLEQGEAYSQEQIHELIKLNINPVDVFNPMTGESLGAIGGSTKGMNVEEFSAFVERARAWLAEMGIEVPPPDSLDRRRK